MTVPLETHGTLPNGVRPTAAPEPACNRKLEAPTLAVVLPLNLIDLILAYAPDTLLDVTTLLSPYNVLPSATVPTAACRILARQFVTADDADPFLSMANLIRNAGAQDHHLIRVAGKLLAPYLKMEKCAKLCAAVLGPIARAGKLDVFKHLRAQGVPVLSHFQVIFNEAAHGGHVDLMKWMYDVGHETDEDYHFTYDATPCVKAGLENGHPEVLYLLCDDNFTIDNAEGYVLAAKSGSTEALGWWDDGIHVFPDKAWTAASGAGHVQVLDWALDNNYTLPDNVSEMVTEASGNGHVHVLDWWLQQKGTFACPLNAIHKATLRGHKHVLDWWVQSGLGMRFVQGTIDIARRNKVEGMNEYWTTSRMYERMLNCNGKSDLTSATLAHFDPLMHAAFGHTLAVSLVRMTGLPRDLLETEMADAVFYACAYGHLNVLEDVVARYAYFPTLKNFQRQVEKAALCGQVAALQLMVVKFRSRAKQADWNRAAACAVDRGHECILDWMWANDLITRPPPSSLVLAASGHGHPQVLEWLRIKGTDIASQLAPAVLEAATHGHLGVLQWIVKHFRARFPAASTRPVDMASANGHWAVLEYLCYEPGIPFLWSEAAVRLATANGHKRVMGWWLRSGLVKDRQLLMLLQRMSSETEEKQTEFM